MPEREFYRWQVRSCTVRVALDVVDSLTHQLRHPRFNPAEEHGGLLFGAIIDTNSVEITGLEFIRSRHHRGAPYDLSLTERHSLERRIQTLARRTGPRPIGYFRTHLRPGLFLDQSDFALMTEAFSEGPGIALAIRMAEPAEATAGIFFWEGGDIDRSQTKLMFPFDAEKLRLQGPIERGEAVRPVAERRPTRVPAVRSRSLVSGLVYALAAGVLAFTALSAYHHGDGKHVVVPDGTAAPVRSEASSPGFAQAPQGAQVLNAPPAAFEDVLPPADDAARSPFDDARRREPPTPVDAAPPQIVARATPPPPQPVLPTAPPPIAPAPIASVPIPTSPAPDPPRAAESAPPRASRPVNVDVSVEAKEGPVLKRMAERVPSLAGHVPLLGRIHALHHNDVVSPRPSRDLTPQIPARVSRDLEDEIRVDVEASIDDAGVVRNAEVTTGAGTEFGPIAAAKVRSVPWQPARAGDRRIPMDVVVHYRFNPVRGE